MYPSLSATYLNLSDRLLAALLLSVGVGKSRGSGSSTIAILPLPFLLLRSKTSAWPDVKSSPGRYDWYPLWLNAGSNTGSKTSVAWLGDTFSLRIFGDKLGVGFVVFSESVFMLGWSSFESSEESVDSPGAVTRFTKGLTFVNHCEEPIVGFFAGSEADLEPSSTSLLVEPTLCVVDSQDTSLWWDAPGTGVISPEAGKS